MKLALTLSAALLLTGCSDLQIQSAQARHRAWVCKNQVTVTTAANLAISEAAKIKDEAIRNAAILAARSQLDIVAGCE